MFLPLISIPAARVYLFHTWIFSRAFFEASTIRITFPNSADYGPTVEIVFYNHTETYADLPFSVVHVGPISENQTEIVNRLNVNLANTNTVLTYLLVGFASIDMILALTPYFHEGTKR